MKNGKTRIVEKTAKTLGVGWAAIIMYNLPMQVLLITMIRRKMIHYYYYQRKTG